MFENIAKFFKKLVKSEQQETKSKDTAKERLHLVLMQDRANVSVDFLELMKQEIIEVIKKYIEVDDKAIDVRLTNKVEEDGTNGLPFLYANIPIVKIKNEAKVQEKVEEEKPSEEQKEDKVEETKEEVEEINKEDVVNEKEAIEVPEEKNEMQEQKQEDKKENKEDSVEQKEEIKTNKK